MRWFWEQLLDVTLGKLHNQQGIGCATFVVEVRSQVAIRDRTFVEDKPLLTFDPIFWFGISCSQDVLRTECTMDNNFMKYVRRTCN
jgi:hypothetical protein